MHWPAQVHLLNPVAAQLGQQLLLGIPDTVLTRVEGGSTPWFDGNHDESSVIIRTPPMLELMEYKASWHGEIEVFNHDLWDLSMVFPMQVPLPTQMPIRMIRKT